MSMKDRSLQKATLLGGLPKLYHNIIDRKSIIMWSNIYRFYFNLYINKYSKFFNNKKWAKIYVCSSILEERAGNSFWRGWISSAGRFQNILNSYFIIKHIDINFFVLMISSSIILWKLGAWNIFCILNNIKNER